MDIVERLRVRSGMYDSESWHSDIELEAANEIERLHSERNALVAISMERADEIERLRAALKRIGEGDTCISLMTHPPICKRAYDARSALQQKDTE